MLKSVTSNLTKLSYKKLSQSYKVASAQPHLPLSVSSQLSKDSGFTMLELLVVIVIVGVLSAIAAPGWIAFVNRQRVSTANNAVLRALQTAQSEAKRTKKNYIVEFKNTSDVPQVAVYQDAATPKFNSLAETQNIGKIKLDNNNTYKVTFDYLGTVQNKQQNNSVVPLPLKVTLSIPNTTVKRCVVVETLLGGMRTAEDTSCN